MLISSRGCWPEGIPIDFLPEKLNWEPHADNYARILISLNTTRESDYAFECMEKAQSTIEKYYATQVCLGNDVQYNGYKGYTRSDYMKNALYFAFVVAMVVMITFGSVLLSDVCNYTSIELAIFITEAQYHIIVEARYRIHGAILYKLCARSELR